MGELIPLLNVEDVSRSLAFYQTALGARVENRWDLEGTVRWARIGFEGGQLMLNTPDGASSTERRGRPEFADAVLYVMCEDAPPEARAAPGGGPRRGPAPRGGLRERRVRRARPRRLHDPLVT
jgi:catechol 2,3-dioxygenase-like lactoylglutathione lyase family enzyme